MVADRCLRDALPMPSKKSLVARIAHVRKNGAPGERAYLHQITLDHCVLTDRTGTAATLSIAMLEPPGTVVAWRLSARPADAVATAMLILEAHMRASGNEPARISARFGRDPGYAAIGAALSQARIDVVAAPRSVRFTERPRAASSAE